jgi:ketosteroid isomerase-like protein
VSNIPTVRSICEAFGRGDIPALLGYLSQNIVWTTEWPSLVCRGRNRDVAGDVAFVIKATDRTVVEEDEVLIWTSTPKGRWRGSATSSTRINIGLRVEVDEE